MIYPIKSNTSSYLLLLTIPTLSLMWSCAPPPPHPHGKATYSARSPHYPTRFQPRAQPPVEPSSIAAEDIRGQGETETALLRGKRLLSQGRVLEAWRQWASLLDPSASETQTAEADAAWNLMLTSYFETSNRDNTYQFLEEIASTTLTASQIRTLQRLARQQPEEKLENILDMQPSGSIFTPFLQISLGDKLAQAGQESEAQALWRDAQQFEGTAAEAARRLSANDTIEAPLRVGLLLPLGNQWASMGEHLLHAAQKALADYRDVPIQLLIGDSSDTAEASHNAMNDLVAQQVDVVVGPVFHASVQPAAEIASAHGIPLITMNPHSETSQTLSGVFSNAFHPAYEAEIMARYAVLEKRYQRITVLAPESEYGRNVTETFSQHVQALGGAVVHAAFFPTDTLDFSPWIKALGKNFEAMFIPASAKQVRLIAPQAAFFEVGVPNVALLGTARWNNPELLIEGTDYLRGAVFCDTSQEENERFKQAFKQSWNEEPSTLATLAYDSVAVLAQLLRDQRQGGQSWYNGLTRTSGFRGASGPLRFLGNGRSQRTYHLFEISGGQVHFLKQAQEPFSKLSREYGTTLIHPTPEVL